MGNFVLVKIETNQAGLWGWGDCTCTGSELGVAKFLDEHMAPGLVGRNPMQLEDLWQTLFFLPYYRSGSVHMSALSGIDMALWDIKGKVADLPVYELLGGRARKHLLTYSNASGRNFDEVEENARKLMARGYKVIKVQVAAPGSRKRVRRAAVRARAKGDGKGLGGRAASGGGLGARSLCAHRAEAVRASAQEAGRRYRAAARRSRAHYAEPGGDAGPGPPAVQAVLPRRPAAAGTHRHVPPDSRAGVERRSRWARCSWGNGKGSNWFGST